MPDYRVADNQECRVWVPAARGRAPGADLDKYSWGGKRVAGDFEGWHPLAEVYADLIAVKSINVNLESHTIDILTQ